ncbi:hypothetical protein [Pseudoxanthomonas sp. PXM02]|uniref:hypothetical protein n=1 Tax=Pseudoxanthomonas sp. PXM02 TaxID=2769294 RepID=UPI0017827C7E|nr:hypothetical protein [Pseudoxanthomonas sp. PXM02]MBD9478382.1 hypothetical protein [Pseudoxanthomonas sp. PXM02]
MAFKARMMCVPALMALCLSMTGAPVQATTPATKPLRFVLYAGMDPAGSDTVNPTCYSNIISRPGPAGWGGPGFLPPGSGNEALRIVESLRADFLAKCRAASQRNIPDTRFQYQWNGATQDSEDRLELMIKRRFREDVHITIN